VDFPIKIGDVLNLGKDFISTQKQGLRLMIYLDPRCSDELADEICTLFSPQSSRLKVFVRILSGEAEADSALIAGDGARSASILVCAHARDIAALGALPQPSCVIVGDDLRSQAADVLGVSILDVVSPRSGEMAAQLGTWFSTQIPARRTAIAADLSFAREAVSREIRSTTAWQNAVIALVPFTHGADLPVLVANQAKMILQLALVAGLELDAQRVPELLVTGAAALGGRRLARSFSPRFPPTRWLSRALISFSITWALGFAVERYHAARGPQH